MEKLTEAQKTLLDNLHNNPEQNVYNFLTHIRNPAFKERILNNLEKSGWLEDCGEGKVALTKQAKALYETSKDDKIISGVRIPEPQDDTNQEEIWQDFDNLQNEEKIENTETDNLYFEETGEDREDDDLRFEETAENETPKETESNDKIEIQEVLTATGSLNKKATLIRILETGAKMADLVTMTGWKQPSVRGVMSTIQKETKRKICKYKKADETYYVFEQDNNKQASDAE